ncbi:MAG: GNAT family N-acetyltransferase [SAR324 cluster bacterium]|nr:GNAT family N-acetyltransferase [SAR324 cluster bacterium]MCZ6728964.1 GNAT family N-acetyltransferase [SAR324 cluster bacterium]MCZ6843786.1 GNAT family N-acetyltransferase [SAR324 cluster bacterium]
MNPTSGPEFTIRPAVEADVPLVLWFIRQLAEYEQLAHEVVIDEAALRELLFRERPYAESIIGEHAGKPVAFALFFHTVSTFLGRPGLYLEDLFVAPEARGKSFGRTMMAHLAGLAMERGCGRFEWSVLDWNVNSIDFYKKLGAEAVDQWTVYRLKGDALSALAGNGS